MIHADDRESAGDALRRGAGRPLVTLALATLGVVLGHVLTYLVLVPNEAARTALLARTGHAYFSVFAQVALAVGAVGAAASGLGSLGREAGSRAVSFGRLARFQVFAFVWMEVAERVASRAGFGELFRADMVVGVLVQIGVAALFAWLVSVLGRVVGGRRRDVRTHPPQPIATLAAAPPEHPAAVGPAFVPPARAPPFALPSLAV
jgi:hypothetical protein